MFAKTSIRLVLALFVGTTALVAHGADSRFQKQLDARSERPPEAAENIPATLEVHPGNRLFYMVGADNAACVRAVADVTGDERTEIIVGIDESGTDNIFCLDGASSGAATVVWSLETTDGLSGGAPYGDQSVVPISDPDDNGHQNVLVGTAWGGRTAYNIDTLAGDIIWRFDTYVAGYDGWVYSLAELNDVTGDGVPEVAFGTGSNGNSLFLVDGASSGGAQATVVWRYTALDAVGSVRDIGDVNGDGDHDVLAAVQDDGDRVVWLDGGTASPSGSLIRSYPASVYSVGVLPDITGDGVDEALAALWVTDGSAVRCLNGATGGLVWSSTEVWDYAMMVDVLQDVNGDGADEVVVGSWDNAVIVLNGASGEVLWETPVGTVNGGDVWTVRATKDMDGDGRGEVVAGSFDYHVYLLDGDDGTVFWAYNTNNRIYSVAPTGDLNDDGVPDVVAGTQDTSNSIVVHVLDGAAGFGLFADGFESGNTSAWSSGLG